MTGETFVSLLSAMAWGIVVFHLPLRSIVLKAAVFFLGCVAIAGIITFLWSL